MSTFLKTLEDKAQLALIAARKRLAALGLWWFMHIYLDHIMTQESGQFHWMLAHWIDTALKPRGRLAGAAPREHAKTSWTLGAVVMAICLKKKLNIVIISANIEEAKAKVRNIITELENNPKIQEDYGDQLGPARDTDGRVVAYNDREVIFKNGVRLAASYMRAPIRGQNDRGERIDLVLLDDPEDDESVRNAEQRQLRRDWIRQVVLNALNSETGSVIWLGTLIHHDSLLMNYVKESNWPRFRFKALNDDDSTLWPGRWPYDKLIEKRIEIGTFAFSKEFQNNPTDPTTQIYKPEYWRFYPRADLQFIQGRLWAPDYSGTTHNLQQLGVRMAIDPAIGEKSTNDYFAYMVLGRQAMSGLLFVLEVRHLRLSFPKQVALIAEVASRWHPMLIVIEAEAYQMALVQAAWPQGLPIEPIKHQQGKAGRIEAAVTHPEAGRLYLPEGEANTRTFCEEAEGWPNFGNDDQLDAYCMCCEKSAYGNLGHVKTATRKRELARQLADF